MIKGGVEGGEPWVYRAVKEGAIRAGYEVQRVRDTGGAQIIGLKRDGKLERAVIRTTRNRWFAFVPLEDGAWKSLDSADSVLVGTVDNFDNPTKVEVYRLPANVVRERFKANLAARLSAGHQVKLGGFGIFISLEPYEAEPYDAGSGLSKEYEPMTSIPLADLVASEAAQPEDQAVDEAEALEAAAYGEGPGTSLADSVQPATIGEVLRQCREQIGAIAGVAPEAVKLDLRIES